MDFYPSLLFDYSKGQNAVWDATRRAFQDDEGLAYYRYPIYRHDGAVRHEPDILLVHRE